MADMLLSDIRNAVAEFEKLEYPTPTRIAIDKKEHVKERIFNHGSHVAKKHAEASKDEKKAKAKK
ncbi:MAG: hypothetical protein ACRDD0_00775, partial [Bacteroidales bacterium]